MYNMCMYNDVLYLVNVVEYVVLKFRIRCLTRDKSCEIFVNMSDGVESHAMQFCFRILKKLMVLGCVGRFPCSVEWRRGGWS